MSIFRLKFLSISALLLIFCFSLPASAQTTPASPAGGGELRLTTSPLPINLNTAPGSSISTPLKIKNDGNQSENLKVTLMKFNADPTTGATILSDRESTDSYFDWVTFSDPTFTLPPGEWKTITATFNVPESASFDYYYAIVFFRADQQVKPGDRQTVLNGGTATLVLLTANVPGAKKQLTVDQFSVSKNIFEFLPATFTTRIKNTGNVHIIPHGNIFISRGNQTVATLDVNATQGSILPNSPRNFQTQWIDGFPVYTAKEENGVQLKDAQGNLIQELKWNWADASKLRVGKYTAKLLLVYDNGQRDVPIEGEVSFWVVPWRLIGGGLLVLIFVLIGLKSTLQNWYRKISNFFSKNK
jgi:hypothetical protein